MAVLTSNERIRRLEDMGLQALRERSYAKAEKIFTEVLTMLNDFRYADELTIALAMSNLAITHAMQGQHSSAERLREKSLEIASSGDKKRPYISSVASLLAG